MKFYKNINNYFDEMNDKNFRLDEDLFSKNAQSIGKIYHEVRLLMKLLKTKLQIKNMIIKYYDLFYTVIKNRKKVM